MNIDRIVKELKSERERLDRAIIALDGTSARRGRPKIRSTSPVRKARRARHQISPAARKRLSLMMKRRWAERKRKGKSSLA